VKHFLFALAAAVALLAGSANAQSPHRVVVLGIDGLDAKLLRTFMDAGDTPNLSALAEQGGFIPLGTSIPPQSPVAWSNVITGMDPGGHGIFDFVALERDTLLPRLSFATVEPPSWGPLKIGRYLIPIASAKTVQLRHGTPFWQLLEERGIATTLFRMPANYPPSGAGEHELSGMGTPDLRGTAGTFSFFTNDPAHKTGPIAGGRISRVIVRDQTVRANLHGPQNDFLEDRPDALAPFEVHVDRERPVAEIRLGEARAVLNEGEWSDWLPIDFELLPGLASVRGMVRVYLKQIRPHFLLYVSPVNIDGRDPAQPISHPPEYARELFESVGPFYTQEMPEDTKALTAGLLTPEEFVHQSGLVLDERRRLLRRELSRFTDDPRGGLLFFYVSSVDQRSHMLWRQMDPGHPAHPPETTPELSNALRTVYSEVDTMVGEVQAALEEGDTLVVMSDHGFAPFAFQAHLNRYLEETGYLAVKSGASRTQRWLGDVDWTRTRAFGMGLNSLYLNVRGRERSGIVAPDERLALAREIAEKLRAWVDPNTGRHVATEVSLREDVYHGPHVEEAPDILVGYAFGYRASWATSTGTVTDRLIEVNDRPWSGDHCMDSRAVPGVLLSNRPLAEGPATLRDLPVSILGQFGVEAPEQMSGRRVF